MRERAATEAMKANRSVILQSLQVVFQQPEVENQKNQLLCKLKAQGDLAGDQRVPSACHHNTREDKLL